MTTLTKRNSRSHSKSSALTADELRTLRPGLVCGGFMALVIAGTLAAGRPFAYASLLIFVLATVVVAVRDENLALITFMAYSAMEGMFKYVSDYSQIVYAVKPALLCTILFLWLIRWRFQRKRLRLPPMSRWLALFLLWGVAQIFHPFGLGLAAGTGTLLIWYVLPILLLPLVFHIVESDRRELQLRFGIVMIAAVVCAFSVVQFKMGRGWTEAHLPGYANMTSTDWWTTDDAGRVVAESFRPASTTAQGGGGGYWGHVGALLSMSLLIMPGLSMRYRGVIAGCLIVNIMGILVSGVRLYAVLFPVEIILWLFFTARSVREFARNVALTAAGCGVMYVGFLGAQNLSEGRISYRYADTLRDPVTRFQKDRSSNFTYLPWFVMNFPLGVGYQRDIGGGVNKGPVEGELRVNRETVFNSTAADLGVPGLILVLILLAGIPIAGHRILRSLKTPDLIVRGAMLLSMLIGYILMGLGGPSLQSADFYWLFAGLLFAMPLIERRTSEAAEASDTGAPPDRLRLFRTMNRKSAL